MREVQADTIQEGAALGLLGLMLGISEEGWCAGWMSGLEYELWQAEPGQRCGQIRLSKRVTDLLKLLSAESGGWWFWDETRGGTRFVSRQDWIKKLKIKHKDPTAP